MAIVELLPDQITEAPHASLSEQEEAKILGEVALFHENSTEAERTLVEAKNYHEAPEQWDALFRTAHDALGTKAPNDDQREWTPLGLEGEDGRLSLVTNKRVSPDTGAYNVVDTFVKRNSGEQYRSLRGEHYPYSKANASIRAQKSKMPHAA